MACYASGMQPKLAQVLNTLAHEIRTPLAVSQGYLKLYLDGRFTNADDTRKAFEQTRQALGTLATLCVDMGKISTLSESGQRGIPERVAAADLVTSLRGSEEVAGATFDDGAAPERLVETTNVREVAQAVAIVAKAAFDEARDRPHAIKAEGATADRGNNLIVVAGVNESLPALQTGPEAPQARAVDFVKGGKGLKLIWAAFVLDKHGVQTWTHGDHRASVGFRIPLVQA